MNDAPVAGDDPDADDDPAAFEVITGGTLDLPAALLLDDDRDADGDALSLVRVPPSATARGSVECDRAGCTYTSDGSGAGVDTFTYTVTDGTATDTATVTVTVTDYAASPVVLVINEVYFQERFAGEEAVEIYNPTPLPVDLAGLRLTDGNVLIGDIDVAGPGWGPLDFTFPRHRRLRGALGAATGRLRRGLDGVLRGRERGAGGRACSTAPAWRGSTSSTIRATTSGSSTRGIAARRLCGLE